MSIVSYTTGTTGGFYITPLAVSSVGDLTSLANGGATTLNAGAIYTQSSFSSAMLGYISVQFAATAWTATAGACLAGWWLQTIDNGTIYETLVATPSSTVAALARPPDFIIPLDAANMSNVAKWSQLVSLPAIKTKIVVQNNSGVTIGSGSHTVFVGPIAMQVV